MGNQQSGPYGMSDSEEEDEEDEEMITINVESGLTGGYPRSWHGSLVATITLSKDSTVSSFLDTVKALPYKRWMPPFTVYTLHMNQFKPSLTDLHRTVEEMGLRSGTLRVFNGNED